MSDDDPSSRPIAVDSATAFPRAESIPLTLRDPDEPLVARMTFTGRGGEYFRIWVVNLFLTVITLGIYSAWAKVRKTKYFWQNAQLDGHVFDFHGDPVAILRGRIVALVLLLAYSWGFEFSRATGLAAIAILFAAGPWLFVKAQQFKFGNTSFRGLRFGFAADFASGYRTLLPILFAWFSVTLLTALMGEPSAGFFALIALAGIVTFVLIPAMHHRLKSFQHANATYGDRHFTFARSLRRFYGVYAKGLGFMVIGILVGGLLIVIVMAIVFGRARRPEVPDWAWTAGILLSAIVVYVFTWPFLAARLQQVVWTSTRCDDVRFRTEIAAWPLFRLVLRNVSLTLVTCGLYWPFAAIALARYRVECMRVESVVPLAAIAAGTHTRAPIAIGDATADTFGFDLGL